MATTEEYEEEHEFKNGMRAIFHETREGLDFTLLNEAGDVAVGHTFRMPGSSPEAHNRDRPNADITIVTPTGTYEFGAEARVKFLVDGEDLTVHLTRDHQALHCIAEEGLRPVAMGASRTNTMALGVAKVGA